VGLLFGLWLCSAPQAQAATAASGWAPTATQAVTLTNFTIHATPLGPLTGTTPLHIVVGLRLQNEAQLDSAILAINTPGNPAYGKFLKPSQFAAAYSPSAAQVQAVESYLTRMGLTNISAPSNRQYVVAHGTAAAGAAAFNTVAIPGLRSEWRAVAHGLRQHPAGTGARRLRRHCALGGRTAKHRHYAHIPRQLACGRPGTCGDAAYYACESGDIHAAGFLESV
jgi:hypothetical protein